MLDATVLLRDMNVDIPELTGELEEYFDRQHNDYHQSVEDATYRARSTKRRGGALEAFGTDLIAKARAGRLDP